MSPKDGIIEGEDGKGPLLGRHEQWHPAIARLRLWYHHGTVAQPRRLWSDRHDHYLLADCHGAAEQRFLHGPREPEGTQGQRL